MYVCMHIRINQLHNDYCYTYILHMYMYNINKAIMIVLLIFVCAYVY